MKAINPVSKSHAGQRRLKPLFMTPELITKNRLVSSVNEISVFATIFYVFSVIIIWMAAFVLTCMPGYKLTWYDLTRHRDICCVKWMYDCRPVVNQAESLRVKSKKMKI